MPRRINYAELVDISQLQALLDNLHQVVGIANAVIDVEGKVIAHAGWQSACTGFHRVNAESCQRCIESDTSLARSMTEGVDYAVYDCLNGLVDAAAPIIVDGEHVANVFTGQVLTKPADIGFFRQQAGRFGFDETAYLEAIAAVPVVPHERVEAITRLYAQLAKALADNGLVRLRQQESATKLLRSNLELEARSAELLSANQKLNDTFFALESVGTSAYWIEANSGRIIWTNKAAADALGYTQHELLRMNIRDIDASDAATDWHPFNDTVRQKGHVRFESLHRCKDGHLMPVEVTVFFQAASHGMPDRHISFSNDITERNATREAMRQAKEAAESANRAKSSFLANMSHELRTPLNGILGMASLARKNASDPRLRHQLESIDTAAHHLLEVINDVLDLSKIEADRLTLEAVDFELHEIVDKVSSVIGAKAREHGLQFTVRLPAIQAGRRFRGDPLRLSQILINLAGNAVKFTEQGSIELTLELDAESPSPSLLHVAVTDTGIGIAEDVQPRLFSAFEQADNSLTRRHGGTGLGLAICKRLVDMMDGQIGCRSELGKGSTFWFTIPLQPCSSPAAVTDAIDDDVTMALQNRHAGLRVLLAEDEPLNQMVARSLLEEMGLQVDVADDGQIALEMAGRYRYPLILMDMQMPNLNGLDATRAIRTLPGHAGTPIVAMTANVFEGDRLACLDAGMNDHLGKPVEPELLFRCLLKWLDVSLSFSAA